MDKRIKGTFIIISVLFLLIAGITTKCVLFYDEENLNALSDQYYRVVDTVYPRGKITDRSGIVFNRAEGVFDYLYGTLTSYPDVASQVTGTVNIDETDTTASSCKGVNGINYVFDDLLNGGSPIKVNAVADANSNILTDMPVSVVGDHINEGCDIELTLDYNLQRSVEDIMRTFAVEKEYERLCAMLTDVETGEILLMATHGTEMNMNMLSYQPGSVMKIIAAACALEEGIISEEQPFVCTGKFPVGENIRSCSGNIIHGETTMKEAFASSCNHWAYEVNRLLTYTDENGNIKSRMLDMANKWGFSYAGKENREFILSYNGYYSFIPEKLYNDMDIFNSALGQGNIQASVYLINKITAAVAGGGSCIVPYIVTKITDPAENIIFYSDNDKKIFDLGLSEKTVSSLQNFMRQTCISGSARTVKTAGAAGKTGTSENIPGKECHSWFTGYFPDDENVYALTVFVENGGNAPQSAVPLFDLIAGEVCSQK